MEKSSKLQEISKQSANEVYIKVKDKNQRNKYENIRYKNDHDEDDNVVWACCECYQLFITSYDCQKHMILCNKK